MAIQYTTTVGTSDVIQIDLADDSGPIDLTTAVSCELRLSLSPKHETISIDLMGSISDPPAGRIVHEWSGEVTEPGTYYAQIWVELADGSTIAVPNVQVDGRSWYRFLFLPALE